MSRLGHRVATHTLRALIVLASACAGDDSSPAQSADGGRGNDGGSASSSEKDSGRSDGEDASRSNGENAGASNGEDASRSNGEDASRSNGEDAGGTHPSTVSDVEAKFKDCQVVPALAMLQLPPILSPENQCGLECLVAGSCSDATKAACGTTASASAAFKACFAKCDFACADNSSQTPIRCDVERQCTDGSDELGCENYYFKCVDGTNLSIAAVCDGVADCTDGSDEAQCRPSFTCGNGDSILATSVCNLQSDCNDGSDEVGCEASCG